MHYAILCYNAEDTVGAWSKEHDDQVMRDLGQVEGKLAKQGRLGPVVRLLPTTSATTVRKGRERELLVRWRSTRCVDRRPRWR